MWRLLKGNRFSLPLVSVGVPLVGHIIEASKDRPYLAVRLVLDPAVVTAVLIEAGLLASRADGGVRALAVSRLDASLLDAVVRLVRLVDAPSDYGALAPLAAREIVYRLLLGEQGGRLRQIAVIGGRVHRIAKAIELLRKNYDKPLRIPGLARQLGLSISGFHHHFKAVTAMSPCSFRSSFGCRRPGGFSSSTMLTPRPPDTGWVTRIGRTSAGSTRGSSASRRCATSSGCEVWPPVGLSPRREFGRGRALTPAPRTVRHLSQTHPLGISEGKGGGPLIGICIITANFH
jgi:AraC-like DNA-binding protein